MQIVFLTPYGVAAEDWDKALELLGGKFNTHVVPAEESSFDNAIKGLERFVADNDLKDIVFVGVAESVALAVIFTNAHPDLVRGIVACHPQLGMDKDLLKNQRKLLKILPKAFFKQVDKSKDEIIKMLDYISDVDSWEEARTVLQPVLAFTTDTVPENESGGGAVDDTSKVFQDTETRLIEGSRPTWFRDDPEAFVREVEPFFENLAEW